MAGPESGAVAVVTTTAASGGRVLEPCETAARPHLPEHEVTAAMSARGTARRARALLKAPIEAHGLEGRIIEGVICSQENCTHRSGHAGFTAAGVARGRKSCVHGCVSYVTSSYATSLGADGPVTARPRRRNGFTPIPRSIEKVSGGAVSIWTTTGVGGP